MPVGENILIDVFVVTKDGEEIPISNLQAVTIDEADSKMGELDFVRVVRCKDCKYSGIYSNETGAPESAWGTRYCAEDTPTIAVEDDHYCSKGERMAE